MIAVVSLSTHAAPDEPTRGPAVHAPVRENEDEDGAGYRPCFLVRPHWNPVPEGPQPRCVVHGSDAGNIQQNGTEGATRGLRPLEVGV